jgi:uncharacterized protein YecE (DUF72 family)
MAEILIGTSGYDYPEWKGTLYPNDLKREEFLSFYAEHFNALEINYTYYGMPNEYQMSSMVKRSSGRLRFSVKAHRTLTHSVTISSWRDDAREFRQALYPLVNQNLLTSVLLQFPQSFHYAVDERKYLDSLIAEFAGLPLVAEFRHASWQNERVYDGLRKRNVGWCVCDLPSLKNLPTSRPKITAAGAYFRFHGRNAEAWHGTNARDRYDYLYRDDELEAYLPVITSLSSQASIVQIYFNNHAKGNAVVNAQKMKILMSR